MNNKWVDASHESADMYKSNLDGLTEEMHLVRILDISGMFETGWVVFKHRDNRFGYPHNEYE